MKPLANIILGSLIFASPVGADQPLITGLTQPVSVAVGVDGRLYVACQGDKEGTGAIFVCEKGKATPLAAGLLNPRGLATFQDAVFVADRDRVLRIDRKGKVLVHAAASAFPSPPGSFRDLLVDPENGAIFVVAAGPDGAAIFRIPPKGKMERAVDRHKLTSLKSPSAIAQDGATHLLIADGDTGELHRVNLATSTSEKIAENLGSPAGLTWDRFGRLYISDAKKARLLVIPRPGMAPVIMDVKLNTPADCCLDPIARAVVVADTSAGAVVSTAAQVPGQPVNDSPLAIEPAVAFPKLNWTGWMGETDAGKPNPLRPIVLTHAGDGTNRVFVATQHGVVHVFPNRGDAAQTKVFLDLSRKVRYEDKTNEEGLLGLAFHPKFKETGEFFVFYTVKKAPHPLTNILSRFRVKKDNPNQADPNSEEELLRIERPFWNHDGGTLAFGPDGMLYLALGDGGAANDPHDNAQNLKTLLGSLLRLDITRKDPGKNYAVPKDNPFVGRPDARPEIWCYGLRNVWRFSFDKKTGVCWAGDVGQNLYEEINHLVAGGNFGWARREGLHPFGPKGSGPKPKFIEPIWEYHHGLGRSITGGHVYRGKALPQIDGTYLYADYVAGSLWALRYDPQAKRVVANQPIQSRNLPVLSFGEDEMGEVYFLIASPTGQGVFRFTAKVDATTGTKRE